MPEVPPFPVPPPESDQPTAFVQFVFTRPDSWEFSFAVGPQTSVYQLAVALEHLKIITENAIGQNISQNAKMAVTKKIMVPGRPV